MVSAEEAVSYYPNSMICPFFWQARRRGFSWLKI